MYKKLNEVKKNWSVPPRRNVHSPSDQADEVEFSSGCTILSLNPDTMSNLDLYNYISKTENTITTYYYVMIHIYIYTMETGLANPFFLWFYLSIFWLMYVDDFIVSNRGWFPIKTELKGSQISRSREPPGREFPGLRHGGDARRRLDVPVLW